MDDGEESTKEQNQPGEAIVADISKFQSKHPGHKSSSPHI